MDDLLNKCKAVERRFGSGMALVVGDNLLKDAITSLVEALDERDLELVVDDGGKLVRFVRKEGDRVCANCSRVCGGSAAFTLCLAGGWYEIMAPLEAELRLAGRDVVLVDRNFNRLDAEELENGGMS